jgi:anti-sigma regulatory factor (Ser/Thr protein kinase)
MDNEAQIRYKIPDRSYSSMVKREIHRVAATIGFTPTRLAEADIVISEMITNLNKHTPEGELLVKPVLDYYNRQGIEIISIDNGKGIDNLAEMIKDGKSTAGTLGQGLGAIKRLSDDFDIYTLPGWGTIVLSRIFTPAKTKITSRAQIDINTLMLPKTGEELCGDGWKYLKNGTTVKLIALDGLGHGPEAHKASKKAVKEFTVIKDSTPSDTIKILHRRIRDTRGAVGMIVHIDTYLNLIAYAGLGNISAKNINADNIKNLVSYNGIIGHTIPNTIHSNSIPWQPYDTLIIYSDGLKSRWDFMQLPNILQYDGSVIAAALYKDFSRHTDDLLIIVIKYLKNENRSYKIRYQQ